MHTSWQWSVAPFQGFASPCGYLQMPLSSHREGTSTGACFVLFWFFSSSSLVLFYFIFLKQKNQSPGLLVAKQLWEKQVEAATKQQCCFLVLFTLFIFPWSNHCLVQKSAGSWEEQLWFPGGQDPAIKLFTKHCQAPGNNNSTGRLCIYFSKNNLPNPGLLGNRPAWLWLRGEVGN